MNILLINSNNPLQASGIVALNLFNDFTKLGHTVKLLTNKFDNSYPDGIISMQTSYSYQWEKSRLRNKFEYLKEKYGLKRGIKLDSRYEFFEFKENKKFYRTNKLLRKAGLKPDVIIVLFAKKFINTKNIYELFSKTQAQIYWLMYDMAALTGGCHYAWECKRYQLSCGSCPGLFSTNPNDITFKNIQYKKSFIDNTDVQIITASEWQYKQAVSSSLFKNKLIHKILISADPHIFRPVDKAVARKKLGITANKKVILFGSIDLTTIRKGMSYLIESLGIFKDKIKNTNIENDILLLIAGREIDGIKESLPFEYHYLGILDNTFGIASAYQLADVFICPSIEDSGPTMINQSVMSGTPVISFEMGVALDLVISGKSGYIAKIKDSEDMAQGLYNILTLSEDKYKQLSINCREFALKVCSPEVQMKSFENLFNLSR
jgi:glycosyltransferase involved in cell wall biosynthesis